MLGGPDPRTALAYIDRLNLYATVFTVPTMDHGCQPDESYFRPAYETLSSIMSSPKGSQEPPSVLRNILLVSKDLQAIAWLLAALVPHADAAPVIVKNKGNPRYVADLVAREGIKRTNKVATIVELACHNLTEMQDLKTKFTQQMRYPSKKSEGDDATASDTLGLKIRKWGPSWSSQIVFALLHEAASNDPEVRECKLYVNHKRVYQPC
jgi:tRNA nucleotidyltransferase (CCA-adding enzyme)